MLLCNRYSLSRLREKEKYAALIVLCFLLSACGFTPLYKDGGKAPHAAIWVPNIPNREGQFLRNLLIDRLYAQGAPETPRYALSVTKLNKIVHSLGIRKDATSTRGQMEITARLTLQDPATGAALLQRDLAASGGFNRLDNRYATVVSEQAATEAVLRELSNTIMTEIDLYFARRGDAS